MNRMPIRTPRASEDRDRENHFWPAFRRLGLPFLRLALLSVALMDIIVIVLRASPPYNEPSFSIHQAARVAILINLTIPLLAIWFAPERAIRNYPLLVGLPIALVMAGVSGIAATISNQSDPLSFRLVGAVGIGCWLVFGFTRLTVPASVLICLMPCTALVIAAAAEGDAEVQAISVYTMAFMIIGWTSAVELERSERERFRQRLRLEAFASELNAKTVQAERVSAQRARLLSFVGHDMRQPIGSLSLNLLMLRSRIERELDSESMDIVGSMDSCLIALTADVSRLLRDETPSVRPATLQRCELAPLLERLRKVFNATANASDVSLRIWRPPLEPVSILTDPDSLWVALSNLTSNAIKYRRRTAGRGDYVWISCVRLGDRVRIEVKDNGIGIEESNMDSIFEERWTSADPGSALTGESFGLGLAIVKESIRSLDGHQLMVVSKPAVGSRFRIYVPAVS